MKAKVYAKIRVDTRDTKPLSDLDATCSRLNTTFSTEKAVSMRRLTLLTNRLNSCDQGVRLSVRGIANSCTPLPCLWRMAANQLGLLNAPSPNTVRSYTAPLVRLSSSYIPLRPLLSCIQAGANIHLSTTWSSDVSICNRNPNTLVFLEAHTPKYKSLGSKVCSMVRESLALVYVHTGIGT